MYVHCHAPTLFKLLISNYNNNNKWHLCGYDVEWFVSLECDLSATLAVVLALAVAAASVAFVVAVAYAISCYSWD